MGGPALTPADNKVLGCTSEVTSDHELPLLLAREFSEEVGSLNLEQLYLVVRHVDQHVLGVLADSDASQGNLELKVVLLFSRSVIVDVYSFVGRDGNQPLPIWRYGTVLDPISTGPSVNMTAIDIPGTQVRLVV